MTLQKIEFMYDIPEGYRFVKYDVPKKNEYYLINGNPIKSGGSNTVDYPIVEKIPEQERPSHNTKRRKHADLIHAWADGAEIEYYSIDDRCWYPTPTSGPLWQDGTKYRIKPKTKTVRVRNYLDKNGTVQVSLRDRFVQDDNMEKWLGDWQEVEIEEND